MTNEKIKEILDDIFLDTERLESLNEIIKEIGNEYARKDKTLSSKIFTLTYCINEIIKSTNNKLDDLYSNLSNGKKG